MLPVLRGEFAHFATLHHSTRKYAKSRRQLGKVSDEQEAIVLNNLFVLVRQYQLAKLELAYAARDRDIYPWPMSKSL